MERSLYDRLGGIEFIGAVVRAFEDRAAKDDRINQKFARTNLDRLTEEFAAQLCQDTGGPCTYTGLSMRQAHTNMGVTSGEFDAFMEDLVATLDGFDVGKAEQDELLNNLRPMRADIVEVDSPQVGTPLPSAFAPAPALLVKATPATVSQGQPQVVLVEYRGPAASFGTPTESYGARRARRAGAADHPGSFVYVLVLPWPSSWRSLSQFRVPRLGRPADVTA